MDGQKCIETQIVFRHPMNECLELCSKQFLEIVHLQDCGCECRCIMVTCLRPALFSSIQKNSPFTEQNDSSDD